MIALRRAPRALPSHLPRETVVRSPSSCHCPDCGSSMRKLGEDVSEMLDFVPGYFKVIRHIRPKLSCVKCSRVLAAGCGELRLRKRPHSKPRKSTCPSGMVRG